MFFLGRFEDSSRQLEQGIAWDEATAAASERRAHVLLHAESPGVICRLHLSCIHWLLGFPDRALATVEAGLALAEALAHPLSLAFSLVYAAIIHLWRKESQMAQTRAEAAVSEARRYSLAQFLAMGTMCRGAALVHLGRPEEGLAELHAGLADFHRTNSKTFDPMWLGFTAEAQATRNSRAPSVS